MHAQGGRYRGRLPPVVSEQRRPCRFALLSALLSISLSLFLLIVLSRFIIFCAVLIRSNFSSIEKHELQPPVASALTLEFVVYIRNV
jgi:hypothetical protein